MKLFYSIAIVATLVIAGLAGFSARATAGPASSPAQGNAPDAVKPATLPSDIDPGSLCRLPLVKREEMDEHGKKIYDLIAGPQSGSVFGLQGPYGLWLHDPDIAALAHPLNYYLRYKLSIGRRLTELGILVTARELDSQYEWTAHETLALKEGLEPQIIDVVRNRKDVAGLGEKETLIITFGRELFGRKKVSSQTFAHAVNVFGEKGVLELAELMGDYASLSAVINAFDIQLRPGIKPLLPIS